MINNKQTIPLRLHNIFPKGNSKTEVLKEIPFGKNKINKLCLNLNNHEENYYEIYSAIFFYPIFNRRGRKSVNKSMTWNSQPIITLVLKTDFRLLL